MNGTRHHRTLAFALLAGLAFSGVARAEDKVYATVDGQPITQADVAALTSSLGAQLAQLPEEARLKAVVERLVDMRLIAQAAAKDGLDKTDSYKKRMEQVRTQLLVSEYVKDKVEAEVSDAMVKARYDKDAAAYNPPEEMHARHILVKTEDEAKAVLADLAKGGDFAKIAEEKSQDPGSAKNGGDLGFFAAGDMVPEFEKAAAALKPGETTKEPVKSQFGWHVIKLEEKRKQPIPSLDQVKDQVRQAVVGDLFTQKLADLKKAAKVDVDEAAIKAASAKPEAPATPSAPAPAK
ncbi:MAG: peptidylprolyl isomerase [Phyllobacteriaceae bacterium]|nr:peptidylprolyl isomerase [Phyllobacteriaceae bacterium]